MAHNCVTVLQCALTETYLACACLLYPYVQRTGARFGFGVSATLLCASVCLAIYPVCKGCAACEGVGMRRALKTAEVQYVAGSVLWRGENM